MKQAPTITKHAPTMIKQALTTLLNDLDTLDKTHPEVTDTEVRVEMHKAVYESFVLATPDYQLPTQFWMFSEAGNQAVRAVLTAFLSHPEVTAARTALSTPWQRLSAFQDVSVRSAQGQYYDWYFGHRETLSPQTP